MERLGYIERTPGRPGTATIVTTTPEGSAAIERATPLLGAINTPQSLGLTEAEASTLNDLLDKVTQAALS